MDVGLRPVDRNRPGTHLFVSILVLVDVGLRHG